MVAGITIPDTCRPKPDTDQLGDNVAGKPCMAAADCNGGSCLTVRGGFMGMGGTTMLPGGYCTGNCTEDSHCGEGGVCSPPLLEGLTGSCFEVCVGDGDCNRIGYRCLEIGPNLRGCDLFPDPLPDNQAGKACSSDADCGGVMDTCDTALPAPGLSPVTCLPRRLLLAAVRGGRGLRGGRRVHRRRYPAVARRVLQAVHGSDRLPYRLHVRAARRRRAGRSGCPGRGRRHEHGPHGLRADAHDDEPGQRRRHGVEPR